MKTEFRLPQDGVEAGIKCFNANGQEVTVSKIVVEPYFHDAKSRVPILYATTTVEGGEDEPAEEVQRFMLTMGGSNGKATLVDRTRKVQPAFETKRQKAKDAAKDDETDVAEEATAAAEAVVAPVGPEEIDLPDEE